MSISWEEARKIALDNLRQWVNSLPIPERNLKLMPWGLSPNEMLREAEDARSEIGQQIVTATIKKMNIYYEELGKRSSRFYHR